MPFSFSGDAVWSAADFLTSIFPNSPDDLTVIRLPRAALAILIGRDDDHPLAILLGVNSL